MKTYIYISLLFFISMACGTTNPNIRYFDDNNVEISKSKFNKIRSSSKMLDIPGDSAHHKKLTEREQKGEIANKEVLVSLLEKTTHRKLDSNKPIVLLFYPGKDDCNLAPSFKGDIIKQWYMKLEEGIYQIAKIKPIYIYKNHDGLEKYDGILTWYPDPNGIVEELFFKYHYPCSSYVVISKSGEYISYFGEFPTEYVWEATYLMNK